jgi:DNA-binding GntR family transcriptional regulator
MDMEGVAANAAGRYKTAQAMVVEGLRDAILRGVLLGGQPIRQDEVASQFGVSRIPVREALRQLEGEGLVAFRPHRGAMVSELSPEVVQELTEIRIALEGLALRLAIPKMTESDLRAAEEILDQAKREPDLVAQWGEFNWRFHSALYAPAQRPHLQGMIKTLHTNYERYLRVYVLVLGYEERGQEEHHELLARCERRDVEGAVELLERHVRNVSDMLLRHLRDDEERSGNQTEVSRRS